MLIRLMRPGSMRRTTMPYPFTAVKHEPKVAELSDKLAGIGLKPFHLPLGILRCSPLTTM
jgi:hypothetical protein